LKFFRNARFRHYGIFGKIKVLSQRAVFQSEFCGISSLICLSLGHPGVEVGVSSYGNIYDLDPRSQNGFLLSPKELASKMEAVKKDWGA